MNEILLNASLKEKLSKKGTNYVVIEVELTPHLKKDVFLEQAELEAIRLYYSQRKESK